MPDIEAARPCATSLGSVSIIGKNESDPTCSLLMKPNPTPNTYALTLNRAVADQVASEMTKASNYRNRTWPHGTSMGQIYPNI